MRGWLKGSIAVLCLALACAVMAPGGAEARVPEESEGIYLEISPRKHVRVDVEIHPRLGVAVVFTEMGPRGLARAHRPWGAVDYAVRIPKGPIDGRLDLKVPGLLAIDGEVTEGHKGLRFLGSLRFRGKGGYLSFDAHHATAGRLNGALICPECRGPNPSLFEFISVPLEFSNQNTQVLSASMRPGDRVTHFEAKHFLHGSATNFEAQALEWLPGNVAAVRTIEVAGASGADFKVSSDAEHPKSATLRPPAPFSGSATYRSVASIRSPASGRLTGRLSVHIFGVKVRLAGPSAKASLFNYYPGI